MIKVNFESKWSISEFDLDFILRTVGPRWNQLQGKTLFITGATGFIGKWILGSLLYANKKLKLSCSIIALSRNPSEFIANNPCFNDHCIKWVEGDISSVELSFKVDFLIHAATDVSNIVSNEALLDSCYLGTRNILSLANHQEEQCKILLLSSGAVYGKASNSFRPISENDICSNQEPSGLSAYTEGKKISESLCLLASKNAHLSILIARLFSIVGPYLPLDKHFAIGNFIRSAVLNEDIVIHGDGSPTRSYLYAADMVVWLLVLLFDGKNEDIFNIGSPEPISIKELAFIVNEVVGGTGKVVIKHSEMSSSASNHYIPAVSKFEIAFNIKQHFGLNEAITKTVEALHGRHD